MRGLGVRLIFSVLFVVISSSFVYSQEAQKETLKLMSPEDVQKLREGAKVLGRAFGIENSDTAASHGQGEHKTFADVADKGLEMMKGLIVSLAETLEKAAPHVWRIMVRQQYAKAVASIILPWGLLAVIIGYAFIAKKFWRFDPKQAHIDNTYEMPTNRGWRAFFTTAAPIALGTIFAIWGMVNLKDASLYLINPEYYAIRDLLMMIMKPGAIK